MWILWKTPMDHENKRIPVLRNMWTNPPVINSSSRLYSISRGKTPSFGAENRATDRNRDPIRKKMTRKGNILSTESTKFTGCG